MLYLKVFNNANSVVYTEQRNSNKVVDFVNLQTIGNQKLKEVARKAYEIDGISICRFEIENDGQKIFKKYLDDFD